MDVISKSGTATFRTEQYALTSIRAQSLMRDVIQLRAGLFHYLRVPALEAKIIAAAHPLDQDDVENAWLLYQNQDIQVFGPNNMPLGH